MAKSQNNKLTYVDLKTELDSVMYELQRDDLDVDKALEYYERGLKLVQQLEAYLKTSENKVKKLKANFSTTA